MLVRRLDLHQHVDRPLRRLVLPYLYLHGRLPRHGSEPPCGTSGKLPRRWRGSATSRRRPRPACAADRAAGGAVWRRQRAARRGGGVRERGARWRWFRVKRAAPHVPHPPARGRGSVRTNRVRCISWREARTSTIVSTRPVGSGAPGRALPAHRSASSTAAALGLGSASVGWRRCAASSRLRQSETASTDPPSSRSFVARARRRLRIARGGGERSRAVTAAATAASRRRAQTSRRGPSRAPRAARRGSSTARRRCAPSAAAAARRRSARPARRNRSAAASRPRRRPAAAAAAAKRRLDPTRERFRLGALDERGGAARRSAACGSRPRSRTAKVGAVGGPADADVEPSARYQQVRRAHAARLWRAVQVQRHVRRLRRRSSRSFFSAPNPPPPSASPSSSASAAGLQAAASSAAPGNGRQQVDVGIAAERIGLAFDEGDEAEGGGDRRGGRVQHQRWQRAVEGELGRGPAAAPASGRQRREGSGRKRSRMLHSHVSSTSVAT